MILSLNNESDVNQTNLKKLENLTSKDNTVLYNYGSFCGYCTQFKPQWDLFKESMKSSKVNFVEIESSALSKLRENKKIYKKITPADGAVYFPMIIVFTHKNNKCEKKLYEGNRDAESLKSFVKSKIPKKEKKDIKKVPLKEKPVKKLTKNTVDKKPLSLFEINKELENILSQLNFR
jgi:thiol-disulfide isomerase/thioredoxin